ncbi:hypothetical protein ACOSQ3_004557 [Xanthoceras sorbifolium]
MDTFIAWFSDKIIDEIKCNASCVSNTLKWFTHGPRDLVMSFNGYIINGLRFHTKEAEKSRQNSGVLVEATTFCRSSARDNTQILGQVAYYGNSSQQEKKRRNRAACEEERKKKKERKKEEGRREGESSQPWKRNCAEKWRRKATETVRRRRKRKEEKKKKKRGRRRSVGKARGVG